MNCRHAGPRTPDPRLRTFFLVSTVIFVLSLGGCAARRPPQPSPSPPAAALPTPQELLAALDTRRQTVQSLRGLARVVYTDSEENGTAKQAVAVAAPDHFRLELFSPIGIAWLVTSNGHALAAYAPQEKAIYRGAATPINAARFTRVMLSSREIVSLLLGLPTLSLSHDADTTRLDPDTDWYRCEFPLPDGGRQVLWFEPQSLLLRRWERRASDDTVLMRVHLAEYRAVNGQLFPFEIVLSDTQGRQEAAVYYERVEINPSLPDSLFTLAPIKGVSEVDLDASATE